MDLTLPVFIAQAGAHPALIVVLVLVIGVTVISGATDAPNAIATAVSTRCLKPGTALALAAVFNFVGLVGMTYISTAVAHTMFNMVNFSGNTHQALMALIAAMIGSIGWGFFCWYRGIPAIQVPLPHRGRHRRRHRHERPRGRRHRRMDARHLRHGLLARRRDSCWDG